MECAQWLFVWSRPLDLQPSTEAHELFFVLVSSVHFQVSLPPQLGGFQMVINTQRLCVQQPGVQGAGGRGSEVETDPLDEGPESLSCFMLTPTALGLC